MTKTRYRILFYLFSIFLALSLFAVSVIYVLASPTHNIGSQINVNYVAPVSVNLNFVNNTGSDIEEGSYSIKYNEDMTQFYIDGIIPSQATYQNGSIINDKGQEFYYFSNVPQDENGNVIGNAGEGTSSSEESIIDTTTSQNSSEENVTLNEDVSTLTDTFVNIPENKNILAKRYYPSSSTDPVWYDLPETDIELYSTFLTPNCTDGTDATIGTNTDIVISHQVTSIPNNAFEGSSSTPGVLTSVVIPNGIISIGSYAFYYNYQLSSVVLPSTLTTINFNAFYYCYGLTNIVIPQKVSTILGSAFGSCSKLIEVDNLSNLSISTGSSSSNGGVGNFAEDVFNSINYDTNLKLYGDGVVMYENRDKQVFNVMGYIGDSINLVFPATTYNYNIYAYAFYNYDDITNITIPHSVTDIGSHAFYSCSNLIVVTFEEGTKLKNLGDSAFNSCSNLTTIIMPSSTISIGSHAFYNCSSLESILLPDGITMINMYTFSGCSGLTTITIPSGVTSIGSYAFYGCSSLGSIKLPEGTTEINIYAFFYCRNLTSITIPSSVTSIGDYAFYGCNNVQELHIDSLAMYLNSLTTNLSSPLYSTGQVVRLYVGEDLVMQLEIPEGVTKIQDASFRGLNITSVTIPASVGSIASSAFHSCSNLTMVTFGDNSELTSIGSYAFYNCNSIISIIIPSSVTSIWDYTFSNCNSLTIYCEMESQPSGWDSNWNYSNRPVYWGLNVNWEYDEVTGEPRPIE